MKISDVLSISSKTNSHILIDMILTLSLCLVHPIGCLLLGIVHLPQIYMPLMQWLVIIVFITSWYLMIVSFTKKLFRKLTPAQQNLVRICLLDGGRPILRTSDDYDINVLVQKSIVKMTFYFPIEYDGNEAGFALQDWAFRFLRDYPDTLDRATS